jgi:thymidylate kinase
MSDVGKLIVFEGADGVGKSTLVGHTEALLRAKRVMFDSYSFPGKSLGTLGRVVDQIQRDRHSFGLTGLTDLSVQALPIAEHIDHIGMNATRISRQYSPGSRMRARHVGAVEQTVEVVSDVSLRGPRH